jgi:hypothetical protein
MLCNFLGLEEQTKDFEIIEKIANVGDIVSEGQRLGLILKKGARGQSIDEIVNYIDDFVSGLDVIIKPIKRDMPLPSHIRVR